MKGLKEIAADIFLAWLILAVTMPNWIKAAEAVKTFAEVWENTRKNIQAMSEEDYKKFLQYLAKEITKLAAAAGERKERGGAVRPDARKGDIRAWKKM